MGKPCIFESRPRRGRIARSRALPLLLLLHGAIGIGAAAAQTIPPDSDNPYYRRGAGTGRGGVTLQGTAGVAGNVHAGGDVAVPVDALVDGDVSATGTIGGGGRITGTTQPGAPAIGFPTLDASELRAAADRVVQGPVVLTDARIDDVLFVNGAARVVGSFNGTGALIATGNIVLEATTAASAPDPASRLRVISLRDLRLGAERKFHGLLMAGRDLYLEQGAEGQGVALAGRNLVASSESTFSGDDIWETNPPTITGYSPGDGEFLADPMVVVTASYTDAESGIYPESAVLLVDSVDRTAEATIEKSSLEWSAPAPLADGTHTVSLSISDHAGNTASQTWSFGVDTTPPLLAITPFPDPLPSATDVVEVTLSYSDAVSGVDVETFGIAVDGVQFESSCDLQPGTATCTTPPLASGTHSIVASISDLLGHPASATATLNLIVDLEPPLLAITPFQDPHLSDSEVVEVILTYSDTGSGIDLSSLAVAIDSIPFESSCNVSASSATCYTPPLVTGSHAIVAFIRDLVNREASASRTLNVIVDLEAPVVEIATPVDGTYQNTPTVQVTGTVTDDGPLDRVELDGVPLELTNGTFSVERTLVEGPNLFTVAAVDLVGRAAIDQSEVRLDTVAPTITIDAPTDGQLANFPTVHVSGRADDSAGIAGVLVSAVPVTLTSGRFEVDVPLAEGLNTILVEATDGAGNLATASRSVSYLAVPAVEITSPADLSWIAATTVDVSGTVSEGATVTVNDVPATVTAGTFLAVDVPLIEGGNLVTATAISATGAAATDHVEIVRDLTAPRLEIAAPRNGQVVFASPIPVTGLVNDLVVGTVSASEVDVWVNDQEAAVSNRQFLLGSLSLTPDEDNVVTVVATDESGNSAQATVHVYYDTRVGPKVEIVSGNLQTGIIGTPLVQPLRVRALDSAGAPVAGVPAIFRVVGGDGTVSGGERSAAVITDAAGEAAAPFQLGHYAGHGSQVVSALAVGYGETEFRATTLPGAPTLIVADAGGQQLGAAGGSVPRPFVAAVTDVGGNRLEAVPVRFTVVQGGGHFEGGATEIVLLTDSDGRAITSFVLGPEDGTANNVVVARIDGLPEGPSAAFVASGWAAGDPAATAIRGIVLDNQNDPVPGVTMRIKDHPETPDVIADDEGRFVITGAPVGTVYLIAIGSTATRPGAWADLEYVTTTIPGREIDLGRPVYLLPIDIANGELVTETQGAVIDLPDVPGFLLEVAPGSVTFPGGLRTGVVSVTAVHSDRVPKTPNFGQQPQLIVTIQPAGARFDPPARMTVPNLEGLPPGTVTEMYSFDHDLSQFVAMGPATVSNDGTVITANPGVGVLKAGWHSAGRPAPPGSACDCPACLNCIDGACVAACPAQGAGVSPSGGEAPQAQCPGPCDDGNPCTSGDDGFDHCLNGQCRGDDFQIQRVDGPCIAAVGEPATFTAVANFPDLAHWTASGGVPVDGTGGTFTTTYDGTRPAYLVRAFCPSAGNAASKSVLVAPTCTYPTPTLVSMEPVFAMEPSATPTQLGGFYPYWAFANRVESCVETGQWCFQIAEVGEQHFLWWGLNPNIILTDVLSAMHDIVNPNTCEQIIFDFTPNSSGTCGDPDISECPPYTQFVSWSAVSIHEVKHESHYLEGFFPEFLENLVGQNPILGPDDCTDCGVSSPPYEEVRQRMMARYEPEYWSYVSAHPNLHQEAEDLEHQCLSGLVAEIRHRARCEPDPTVMWPEPCKEISTEPCRPISPGPCG